MAPLSMLIAYLALQVLMLVRKANQLGQLLNCCRSTCTCRSFSRGIASANRALAAMLANAVHCAFALSMLPRVTRAMLHLLACLNAGDWQPWNVRLYVQQARGRCAPDVLELGYAFFVVQILWLQKLMHCTSRLDLNQGPAWGATKVHGQSHGLACSVFVYQEIPQRPSSLSTW